MNRATPLACLLAALALTAACGSKVPENQSLATTELGPASSGGVAAATTGTAGALAGGTTGVPGSSAGGGGTGGVAGVGTTGGAAGTTAGGGTTGATGAVAGPVDKTPIKIGAFYLNGGNATLGSGFASTPANFGDGQKEAKAVVADINAHGGVGGRKIELYLQKVEASDASKPAAFDAACRGLTEDHHVLAILSIFNLRTPLAACAAKHKTLLLTQALGAGDEVVYRQFRDWAFTPSMMSLDTEQKLVISNALATGVISKKTRVGVLVQNDDDIYPRVLKNTIEPALKAAGVPYESVVISNATDSTGISNAILKFQQDGVSVVQFSAGNGGIPEVLFMQAADQQQYRPRYIMGDSTDTWFVSESAPRTQAQNITGVGGMPIANVNVSQYPTTAREKHCLDAITAGGERVTDRHSSITATAYCEMFYGFAAAGALVQGPLTADSWRSAYTSMGTTYPAMAGFNVDVSTNPNAGTRGYRTLAWSNACTCVTYTSPIKRLT
ncbi:MAG: hypothetical protein QOE05_3098 [Actinomycetota bacterium]|nr:hypothetical protein [Actinomycetota bacterium]